MDAQHPVRRVLLAAGRAAIERGPVSPELVREIEDWDAVLEAAALHAMTPLLHRWLVSVHADLPPEPAAILRAAVVDTTRHNLLRAAELVRIVEDFLEAGLELLAFKGPVLAQVCYANLGLRQFGDLDLLVRWEQLPEAVERLRQGGYGLQLPVAHLVRAAAEGAPSRPVELPLAGPRQLVAIDLHTAVSNRLGFTFDLEGLWRRQALVRLGGRSIPALSLEDRAHYLAVHGTQHGWGRLGWVVDHARVLQQEPLRWDVVLDRAAGGGSARMVRLGAGLARELLGLRLPPRLAAAVDADRALPRLVQLAIRHLFSPDEGRARIVAERYRLQLQAWDHPRAAGAHLSRALLGITMNDYAVLPLSPRAMPLYRLVRPLRLAALLAGSSRARAARRDSRASADELD